MLSNPKNMLNVWGKVPSVLVMMGMTYVLNPDLHDISIFSSAYFVIFSFFFHCQPMVIWDSNVNDEILSSVLLNRD